MSRRCGSGPNGIRTRVSTLRGSHPWPLDDGTAGAPGFEPGLPEPESGALPGYATPQRTVMVLAVQSTGKDLQAPWRAMPAALRHRCNLRPSPRNSLNFNSG